MSFLQKDNNEDDLLSFVIFYGSQLGQAKSIAEGLADVAEGEFGFKARVLELNVVRDVGKACRNACLLPGCRLNDDDKIAMWREYHEMSSYEVKRTFLLNLLSLELTDHGRRITYTVPMGGKKEEVCQKTFLEVFSITKNVIQKLTEYLEQGVSHVTDHRGAHLNRPHQVEEELHEEVRLHLRTYPLFENHYSRRDNGQFYLPCDLSVAQIYRDFVGQRPERPELKNKEWLIRKIFKDEALKIGKPKSDTCMYCDRLQNRLEIAATPEDRNARQAELEAHHDLADVAVRAMYEDVQRSRDDPTLVVKCVDLEQKDLKKLTCPIVIVTSTTGDGEPPENADKFWRRIRKKALGADTLSSVKYTILGLGDTNYNSFCNCGKEFNRRFQDLGATTFYDPAWADDAVGLESTVDDWIENLWPALESLIRPSSSIIPIMEKDKTALTAPALPPISLKLEWLSEEESDSKNKITTKDLVSPLAPYPLIDGEPVEVKLKGARVLTKPGAVKTVFEVSFEFVGKPFDFEPGDAISVVCPNSDDEIDKIFDRLGLTDYSTRTLQLSVKEGSSKGKVPVHIPATIVLRDLFRYYLDVRSCPRKNLLRLLAEHTTDSSSSSPERSELLHLSSRQGSSDFESKIRSPGLSLLDILLTYPSCSPPLEALIEYLPRLSPRPYSVSSSPLDDEKSFSFVFNVVVFDGMRKYERFGVCTGWLAGMAREKIMMGVINGVDMIEKGMGDLAIDDNPIIVYKRKNQHFKLPPDSTAPIVMVGPGTGVAPFVGFVRHRDRLMMIGENDKNKFGDMSLYFGCRHKEKDFLYEEELKSCRCLSSFYPVFSRDGGDDCKVRYVQHRMEQNKSELVKTLLDDGGYLYVCGDARNMAKDVRETLVRIVGEVKGVGEDEAKKLVGELSVGKRYLQDIWS